MALPQHIHFGRGGTIHIDLLDRPSNALVSINDGGGTQQLASRTCNVSTINTTLAAAVTAGATSVNVASNTGIAAGSKFWLQDDPEECLARKVDGATIYLRRPVVYEHVNGGAVEGTRVSCDLNSTDANTLYWDGHADWNINGSVQYQTMVECTKYPMGRLCSLQDVLDEEPMFYHLHDNKMDVERTLDLAYEDVLARIASKSPEARARVWPGSSEFIQATVFAFMERFYRRRQGDEQEALRARYEKKFQDEVERICGVLPRDADQDGVVEVEEKISWGSLRIRH